MSTSLGIRSAFTRSTPTSAVWRKPISRFSPTLRGRAAKVSLVLGDARLSLERELSTPQHFDVLVLDAFTSASVPTHLLTSEAFEVYRQQLAPGGAIAIHVTNRYIDLAPVVYGLAEAIDFQPARIPLPRWTDRRHNLLEIIPWRDRTSASPAADGSSAEEAGRPEAAIPAQPAGPNR
jgi:hypothetical protein